MVSLFGGPGYDESNQREGDIPFEEQLRAFEELHKEGRVRYFGVSNETSFGVMSFGFGVPMLLVTLACLTWD